MAGRERNPERSRERILAAALEEFAAKGFAGARVEAIAQRAGLNKQLISHHFGGKEALYRAVISQRWATPGGELVDDELALPDALARIYERARRDELWPRILLWETLDGREHAGVEDDPRLARYQRRIAWVRAEQEAGRLPAGLEPDLLFISLLGASVYPLLVPRVAELVSGEDPASDAFARRWAEHLERFTSALMDAAAEGDGGRRRAGDD